MITHYAGYIPFSRVLGIVLVFSCFGSGPASATETSDLKIKRQYTDEDAPPEIRFRHMLLTVLRDVEGDRGRSLRRLEKMGFDAEDAPSIKAYFDSLNDEAQAEINDGTWRLACHTNASNLNGLQIRVVYNSFDDLRFAVAAKYLAIASAELASMGYPDFMQMISGFPGRGGSFRTISTDHRFAWGETDDLIQENRRSLCNSISERHGREIDQQ